jgi:4-hydroxy-2-oxoheptanedioate aldolase
MNNKELIQAMHGGQRVYGTAVLSTSPHWPEALKSAGIDFVFIDTEHIPIERTTLSWMCRTFRALDLAPVVRIPAPDPYEAAMVLDGGAGGVLAPYIETPEQVRALRGAVKLRPLKGRLLKGALDGQVRLPEETTRYLDARNSSNALLINIESTPAVEALDEILDVGGVDAVIVGPHDLSCSLGVPEQYEHPRFEEAIRTIIAKSREHGVGAGVHAFWDSVPQQIRWAEMGGNVILHSADLLLFRKALRADLQQIKTALGGPACSGGPVSIV